MKDMKKKINQYLLTICAIFVAVVGMVFWHLQFYESAIFILLSWTALLSLYFAGEETKSVERERTTGDGQFEQGQYEFHDQLYQRTRKVDYR